MMRHAKARKDRSSMSFLTRDSNGATTQLRFFRFFLPPQNVVYPPTASQLELKALALTSGSVIIKPILYANVPATSHCLNRCLWLHRHA